jgi:hypothetical protein
MGPALSLSRERGHAGGARETPGMDEKQQRQRLAERYE